MKARRWVALVASLLIIFTGLMQIAPAPALAGASPAWGGYLVRTFTDASGQSVDEAVFPSKPPAVTMAAALLPDVKVQGSVDSLTGVPTFEWSYGCSATSAAMLAGYYDGIGYSNLYVGPTNGGVCPQTNAIWGQTSYPGVTCVECPLSASHLGVDGRATKGSVDDYWIDYNNPGPDPYVTGNWTEHAADSLGDFMGTNQAKFGNVDGGTTFYFANNGTPLYDYSGGGASSRDGDHGLRLFFQSRGYSVDTNYSQYIDTYHSGGFTFQQFEAEIDAGYPVLIQVSGHTMLGLGYEASTNTIYVHDTWDYSTHTMTWGGSYAGMQQYGVTVIHPHPVTSASITVGSPNGGENWTTASSQNITWASVNVSGNVNIQISRDGGSSWTDIITGTPNDGTEAWTVTGVTTTQARVKVTSASAPSVSDASNADFTISDPPPAITVSSPNGGENWFIGSGYAITWTSTGVSGNVKIQISRDGGSSWTDINSGTANDGSEAWTVTGVTTTQARVKVISVSLPTIFDTSNANFGIAPAPPTSITVVAPNGEESWATGSTHAINWSSANLTGSVDVQLSRDGGSSWSPLFTATTNDGTENWLVTGPVTALALVKVASSVNGAVFDISNASFIIINPPVVTVLSPNGGESWQAGSSQNITWSVSNLSGNVRIDLLKGGSLYGPLSASVDAASGTFTWPVSLGQTPGTDYRIQITSTDGLATDSSNGDFTIAPPPPLTLTSPNGGESLNAGAKKTITWSYRSISGYLKIELLQNDLPVKTITSRASVSSGSYSWTISSTQTSGSNYCIRLTSTSNPAISDVSDQDFTINGPPPPAVSLYLPSGGETLVAGTKTTIRWTSVSLSGYLKVELLQGGAPVKTLTSRASVSSGSYSWSISSTQATGSDYSIRVTSTSKSTVSDESGLFAIQGPPPPAVTVVAPNGGQTITAGSRQTISWTAVSLSGYVRIELLQGDSVVLTITSRTTTSNRSYTWSVPSSLAPGDNYRIRITSTSIPSASDVSDGVFSIG